MIAQILSDRYELFHTLGKRAFLAVFWGQLRILRGLRRCETLFRM